MFALGDNEILRFSLQHRSTFEFWDSVALKNDRDYALSPHTRARGMLFDRQTPLLREENNVLSVFGKIE